MIRTKGRIRLGVSLLILNLAFIWGNSLIPGEVSGQISRWVGQVIKSLLNLPVNETEGGHFLLRKLGHFSEFACLGLLLTWLTGMAGQKGFHLVSLPLFGGLTAACLDETIQVFVADRGSSLIDVWIDTCGVAAGMALIMIGHHFIRKRKHKNILEVTR